MQFGVPDLVAALTEFPRYRAIGVFADDLVELGDRSGLRPLDRRRFVVAHEGEEFVLEIFELNGVARLSKRTTRPAGASELAPGIGSADVVVDAARDAARKEKGEGALGGLLLGLLIGDSAEGNAWRAFTLEYDRQARGWRPYDGGLLSWMKSRLAVAM